MEKRWKIFICYITAWSVYKLADYLSTNQLSVQRFALESFSAAQRPLFQAFIWKLFNAINQAVDRTSPVEVGWIFRANSKETRPKLKHTDHQSMHLSRGPRVTYANWFCSIIYNVLIFIFFAAWDLGEDFISSKKYPL